MFIHLEIEVHKLKMFYITDFYCNLIFKNNEKNQIFVTTSNCDINYINIIKVKKVL